MKSRKYEQTYTSPRNSSNILYFFPWFWMFNPLHSGLSTPKALPPTEHYLIRGQEFFSVLTENSLHSERKNSVLPGSVACSVQSDLQCHTPVQCVLQVLSHPEDLHTFLDGNSLPAAWCFQAPGLLAKCKVILQGLWQLSLSFNLLLPTDKSPKVFWICCASYNGL